MLPLSQKFRGAAIAVLACSAVVLAGCSSTVTPRAIPAADELVTSTTQTSSSAPTTGGAPAQQGEDTGGDVDIDVEIGECVDLGGTVDDATIDNAACGSVDSNYKVIGKAPTNAECISDADQYYYETYADIEQGALCLDIDWVIGGCMDIPMDDDPERIDCGSPGFDSVRVVEILSGTTDVDSCDLQATSGFRYPERNFVVCVEDL
ncbi:MULTISPECIES: LppU family putative lipoprotein [Nocardiaceae]|jgi:hypothetical protein|uniref:LppU family putative lipoprotein n=1 Tax=Nocardiaceae TaxID=85025 RepID=UPI0005606030|nr:MULTISPECIES: hypothetical protein [Rhodococcus]OZF03414.1 hypothetical protein CH301_08315 [Rhodococcus sp. 15-1189-1-1a]OZF17218.1 hypothetical protein CH299_08865 [Rhodococcus sp. 14-2686-1-2]OZF54762.1 hypothetical protein CH293_08695 [Rhodococcus sp. 14-2470-1b]